MTFRQMAILSSALLFALAAVWMWVPELLLTQWGVAYSSEVGLISRRAAAFYAGIAVMLLLARNAELTKARSALALGLSVACFILATLGVLEWHFGTATAQILVAVALETLLGIGFLLTNKGQSINASIVNASINIDQRSVNK